MKTQQVIDERFTLKYELSHPLSNWQHQYTLVCRNGGVQLWIRENRSKHDDRQFYGGLEIHYNTPPDYMAHKVASRQRCWLTELPCWHDGTSLYVDEHVIPIFEPGRHGPMFGELIRAAKDRLGLEEAKQ